MKLFSILLFFPIFFTVNTIAQTKEFNMNNQKLESILKKEGEITKESEEGYWQVIYNERPIIVITDITHNRMRIISPIIEQKDMTQAQYETILKAQFDRALDVKYALYDNILWSVFAHPLQELTEKQVKDALSQVFYAAKNFGGTYSSTDIIFGGEED